MAKIHKAWVQTHERADGVQFYTAHVQFKIPILWFLSLKYVHHVCLMWSATSEQPAMYNLCSNNSFYDPHKFSTRQEAEDQLMDEIDKVLDGEKEKQNSKIVKTTVKYVPLCPINDDRGVYVDLES